MGRTVCLRIFFFPKSLHEIFYHLLMLYKCNCFITHISCTLNLRVVLKTYFIIKATKENQITKVSVHQSLINLSTPMPEKLQNVGLIKLYNIIYKKRKLDHHGCGQFHYQMCCQCLCLFLQIFNRIQGAPINVLQRK